MFSRAAWQHRTVNSFKNKTVCVIRCWTSSAAACTSAASTKKEGRKSAWCFLPPGGPELLVDLQCESAWGNVVLTLGQGPERSLSRWACLPWTLLHCLSPPSALGKLWVDVPGLNLWDWVQALIESPTSSSADVVFHMLCSFFFLWCIQTNLPSDVISHFLWWNASNVLFPQAPIRGILKREGKALKVIGSSICLSPTDEPIRFVYGRN